MWVVVLLRPEHTSMLVVLARKFPFGIRVCSVTRKT
jgi:hypothetical protein